MKVYLLSIVLTTCCLTVTGTLDCYTCFGVSDKETCNKTVTCRDFQSCYMDMKNTDGDTMYNLGCLDNQHCNDLGPNSVVGRQAVTEECKECCTDPLCNKGLCGKPQVTATTTPTPDTTMSTLSTCTDDTHIDCTHLNNTINICADREQALVICKHFCDFCDVVDGQWSDWLEWSSCGATCGYSTRARSRTCTNPAPYHGGKNCTGLDTDISGCNMSPCAVDGGWSDWEQWSVCSSTCGAGLQKRQRTCSNPAPSSHGEHCHGDSTDIIYCNNGTCNTYCNSSPCRRGGVCIESGDDYVCICPLGTSGKQCEIVLRPHSCNDIIRYNFGFVTGVYDITLPYNDQYKPVLCEMERNGDVWTVFQRRFDGSVNFQRNMQTYINGFGNIRGEFWLGLEAIHQMTSQGNFALKIDLEATDGTRYIEVFSSFSISGAPDYTLHVSGGKVVNGTTDHFGLTADNGHRFSTYDHDNAGACAKQMHSGWWHGGCTYSNLNGLFQNASLGMFYYDFRGYETLQSSKLMFRQVTTL
ncbi:hypothetical protein ACF0H5_024261 [Mactra antiquata]